MEKPGVSSPNRIKYGHNPITDYPIVLVFSTFFVLSTGPYKLINCFLSCQLASLAQLMVVKDLQDVYVT